MTFANEGGWDRLVRIIAGMALMIAGGTSVITGVVGTALTVAGGVAFLTGLSGWCPAYSVFHLSTARSAGKSCAHCAPSSPR